MAGRCQVWFAARGCGRRVRLAEGCSGFPDVFCAAQPSPGESHGGRAQSQLDPGPGEPQGDAGDGDAAIPDRNARELRRQPGPEDAPPAGQRAREPGRPLGRAGARVQGRQGQGLPGGPTGDLERVPGTGRGPQAVGKQEQKCRGGVGAIQLQAAGLDAAFQGEEGRHGTPWGL